MKKVLSIFAVAAVLVAVSACGNNASKNASEAEATESCCDEASESCCGECEENCAACDSTTVSCCDTTVVAETPAAE